MDMQSNARSSKIGERATVDVDYLGEGPVANTYAACIYLMNVFTHSEFLGYSHDFECLLNFQSYSCPLDVVVSEGDDLRVRVRGGGFARQGKRSTENSYSNN